MKYVCVDVDTAAPPPLFFASLHPGNCCKYLNFSNRAAQNWAGNLTIKAAVNLGENLVDRLVY